MSNDVAAVLAEAFLLEQVPGEEIGGRVADRLAGAGLSALTTAGYAVVAVPEGVTVAHGARLVPSVLPAHPVLYRIHEAMP